MSNPPKNLAGQKTKDFPAFLRRAFFAIFSFCFTLLFIGVLLGNMHFSYNPLWAMLAATFWIAVFYGLWYFTKTAGFLCKKEKTCLTVFFIALFVTQFVFYYFTGAYPMQDFERVFTAAYNFSVNGFIEDPYLDYLYKFPNNMPITIVLQFAFRLFRKIGLQNPFTVGALLNATCFLLTYIFVYLSCRKLLGIQKAFFAILLMFFCLPLQSYISIFYTDTLTLWCAPFAFYMFLHLKEAKSLKCVFASAGILSIGLALGVAVKYSAVLVFIAIILELLLRADWKKLASIIATFILAFALISTIFNTYMYANFLDKEKLKDSKTPFITWVMMGLKGSGEHNPDDNYLVWQWDTAEEKQQAAKNELTRRIENFTPFEFMLFLFQKGIRSFGSGNLDSPVQVGSTPMHENAYNSIIAAGGPNSLTYDTFVQGYHIALFTLIIAGAMQMFRKRKFDFFVPYLSVFGLYLFLLLWESGHRYLLNYFAMFIICATAAASFIGKSHIKSVLVDEDSRPTAASSHSRENHPKTVPEPLIQ